MKVATLRRSATDVVIRPARPVDVPALEALIARSAVELSRGYYRPDEIAAAVGHVFGVDSQLVADGTYLVAEREGVPVGCGGWSRRRTLFGGDRFVGREDALLDPAIDPARIRAFFVAPGHARQGIATALLAACEAEAAAAGFRSLTLMATMPGVPFYRAMGFVAGDPVDHRAGDVTVAFRPMTRSIMAD